MKSLLVLSFLCSALVIQAQTKYIQTFDDYFLVKTSVHNSSLNLSLSPRENGLTRFLQTVWYRPSVQNMLGLGVGFKDISLNVNFKLRQKAQVRERQGNSAYSNIQLHSYGKRLGFDIYYQRYRGYFIEDFTDFVNVLSVGDAQEQRDDLRLRNFSTNVYYVFHPDRFSYRSAFVLDERQIRSGGSFILTGSLGYFQALADSSFIPSDTDIEFHPEANFNAAAFYTFAVTPGYGHTFVMPKGFYFSVGVSGLLGLQFHEGQTPEVPNRGVNYFLKGILRSSLGYNVEKWVTGISVSTDIQGMNTQHIQFRSNNLDIALFLAHRIKTNWMKGKKSFFDFLKKKKKRVQETD